MFDKFGSDYFADFVDSRDQYAIAPIEQINLEGMRLYNTPTGARYPSMSSVTKLLSEDAIEQWRRRVGPDEAAKVGARASRRGTAVHKLAEHYVLGETELFTTAFRKSMPDARANWIGLKETLDANLSEIRASECQLYSNELRLAGTTDCIGVYQNKLSVIDFKTSGKLKNEEWIEGYFVQCDGYGQMWKEQTGETPENIVIIIATDEAHEPQVFVKPFGLYLPRLKKLRLEFFKRYRV